MAIDEKIINRINELARKKKSEGLTKEEVQEQKELREKYLESFRVNMKSTLNNIDIVDKYELNIGKYIYDDILKLKDEDGIKDVKVNKEIIEIFYDYKKIDKNKVEELIKKVDSNGK